MHAAHVLTVIFLYIIVSTRVLRLADVLGEHNVVPTANQKAVSKL